MVDMQRIKGGRNEYPFLYIGKWANINKDNNKPLFIHHHNNRLSPERRAEYELWKKHKKLPELKSVSFGFWDYYYEYWHNIDSVNGV